MEFRKLLQNSKLIAFDQFKNESIIDGLIVRKDSSYLDKKWSDGIIHFGVSSDNRLKLKQPRLKHSRRGLEDLLVSAEGQSLASATTEITEDSEGVAFTRQEEITNWPERENNNGNSTLESSDWIHTRSTNRTGLEVTKYSAKNQARWKSNAEILKQLTKKTKEADEQLSTERVSELFDAVKDQDQLPKSPERIASTFLKESRKLGYIPDPRYIASSYDLSSLPKGTSYFIPTTLVLPAGKQEPEADLLNPQLEDSYNFHSSGNKSKSLLTSGLTTSYCSTLSKDTYWHPGTPSSVSNKEQNDFESASLSRFSLRKVDPNYLASMLAYGKLVRNILEQKELSIDLNEHSKDKIRKGLWPETGIDPATGKILFGLKDLEIRALAGLAGKCKAEVISTKVEQSVQLDTSRPSVRAYNRIKDKGLQPVERIGSYIPFKLKPQKDLGGLDFVRYNDLKAPKEKIIHAIVEKWRKGEIVNGRIMNRVKGGYSVAIAGFICFLPNSQMILPKKHGELFGKLKSFIILNITIRNRTKLNIVVGRVPAIVKWILGNYGSLQLLKRASNLVHNRQYNSSLSSTARPFLASTSSFKNNNQPQSNLRSSKGETPTKLYGRLVSSVSRTHDVAVEQQQNAIKPRQSIHKVRAKERKRANRISRIRKDLGVQHIPASSIKQIRSLDGQNKVVLESLPKEIRLKILKYPKLQRGIISLLPSEDSNKVGTK